MIASRDEPSKLSDETTPLGVFLVKSDSTEEKLLFRFPHVIEEPRPTALKLHHTKYALVNQQKLDQLARGTLNEPTQLPAYTELTSLDNLGDQAEITKVIGLTDVAFSNLFGAVKHKLCDQKFELKVDNVRFVGHPTLFDKHCFHVVFALKANAPHDVVKSYHELSQHIAIALRSEERRCRYFSKQSKVMISCHDEIAMQANQMHDDNNIQFSYTSPYPMILEKSMLAKELKEIFIQLSKEGVVHVRLNQWINVNFCLPQKVHRKLMASASAPPITPANIQSCLKKLRPYHTFLLLEDTNYLLDQLPQDVSPSLVRLIRVSNPLKNLLELSADADITLSQVFNVVAQLVYWGKATVIFPLCESNLYMLHPSAPTARDSQLVREFDHHFVGESLLKVMSKFSLGVSLSQLKNPLISPDQESKFVHMIVWMLKKRLLLQLHTYIFFVPLENDSPFLTQRLSQTHPSERPHSSSGELNEASTTTASSYQSDVSLGASPANPSSLPRYMLADYESIHSPAEIELNKVDMDQISAKDTVQMILRDCGLTTDEINAVVATPVGDNVEDIRMFAKLVSYFDGHHHIEDIMYYENLRRSQILTIIDKFREVLITCQYEDTTVAELLPYKTLQ